MQAVDDSKAERSWDGHTVSAPSILLHPHTDFAHRYWAAAVSYGDTIVDATAGNGHDTAFLAATLGKVGGGTLVVIDVQALAIERSMTRLREAFGSAGWNIHVEEVIAQPSEAVAVADWRCCAQDASGELRVRWMHGCHATIMKALPAQSAKLVVFNLGYLPAGDRTVATIAETTVQALEAAERVVQAGGCVSCTIYTGHPEGVLEETAVLDHAASLDQGRWSVYHTTWINQRNRRNGRRAPSLLLLQHVHE